VLTAWWCEGKENVLFCRREDLKKLRTYVVMALKEESDNIFEQKLISMMIGEFILRLLAPTAQ